MTSTTFLRRSVAVLASGGAAVALTLLPSASAHASVAGLYAAEAETSASFQGSGGGSCTLSAGTADTESSIKHFSHGTKNASASVNATYTNSLDSGDSVTIKGHVDSTMTLHKKNNDLTGFALTAGGTIQVDHTTTGSQCHGMGEVLGATETTFTEHHKGWFYVTRDTKKPNSLVEFVLINTDTGLAITLDVFEGSHSHVTSRVLLKPGSYEMEETEVGVVVGGEGVFKTQPRSAKAKQTVQLTGQFKAIKH